MNCNDAREQLALRLYGELDDAEAATLRDHIEGCEECGAYSDELDQGLGRLAVTSVDDLPGDWVAELRERVGGEPESIAHRSRAAAFVAAGIGLAAGFLLALAITPLLDRNVPPEVEVGVAALPSPGPAQPGFRRASAPPLALASGQVDRLRSYLSR